jgi:hypothetical protein
LPKLMSLRELMCTSPVCDGANFILGLNFTYRNMWRRYCTQLLELPVSNDKNSEPTRVVNVSEGNTYWRLILITRLLPLLHSFLVAGPGPATTLSNCFITFGSFKQSCFRFFSVLGLDYCVTNSIIKILVSFELEGEINFRIMFFNI